MAASTTCPSSALRSPACMHMHEAGCLGCRQRLASTNTDRHCQGLWVSHIVSRPVLSTTERVLRGMQSVTQESETRKVESTGMIHCDLWGCTAW